MSDLPNPPPLDPDADGELRAAPPESARLVDRIRQLVSEQRFAVLCTQGQGQPYGSLVAFGMNDDLTTAVFATAKATRKFRLLSECDHVALLIDSRSKHADDMMRIEAVTVTGRATLVEGGDEWQRCAAWLTRRHPQLEAFVRAASCALFRVDLLRYLHVCRFQEVAQWTPNRDG